MAWLLFSIGCKPSTRKSIVVGTWKHLRNAAICGAKV